MDVFAETLVQLGWYFTPDCTSCWHDRHKGRLWWPIDAVGWENANRADLLKKAYLAVNPTFKAT
jgi:hypothetical protein